MNGHVICVFRLVIMDRVYNGNDAQTLVWTEMIFVSRLLFKWKRTRVDVARSLLLYFLTKYAHNECLLSVVTASVSKSTRNELLRNITLKVMLFCTFKFLFFTVWSHYFFLKKNFQEAFYWFLEFIDSFESEQAVWEKLNSSWPQTGSTGCCSCALLCIK